MSNTADVLKEFLVAIGFKVDTNSLNTFDRVLVDLTLKAAKLGAEIEGAAAAVVAAVAKIASGMEQLYFASARTNTSVENIQAFSFAATQLGSSATAARASLENLANFLRSSPAAASLINSLGVATSANGKPRDETAILADLGTKFATMPIWRAQAYAARLGIDQNTLFAMINGLGQLEQAYRKMYQAAGLDSTGGAGASHQFMIQLRTLGAAFEILGIKIEASLAGGIGGDIDKFRRMLVANFGNISDAIVWLAKGFLALADLFTGTLLTAINVLEKLYHAYQKLNPEQKSYIDWTLGLIAAWKALNIAFATSPTGQVILLAAALLLLYQDYETWKHGGQSLIDWSKWEPDIEKAKTFIIWFAGQLNGIAQAVGGWQVVFGAFLTYFTVVWSVGIIGRLATILGMLAAVGRSMLLIGGAGATAGAGAGGGILATAGAALVRLAGGAAAGAYAFFGNPFGMWGSGGEAPLDMPRASGINDFQNSKGGPSSAKAVRDLLMSKYGWSKSAADGIVANMVAESNLDPTRVGDNGQAYGIGQWHPDRQADFQKLFGHPIQGSTLGEQVAFYNAELHGVVDGVTLDAGAGQAGKMLNQPGMDDATAGVIVSQFDERPLDPNGMVATARGALATTLGTSLGAPSAAPAIVQTNNTTITAPSSVTAAQLAAHQGRVNQTNARNLATAVNRS